VKNVFTILIFTSLNLCIQLNAQTSEFVSSTASKVAKVLMNKCEQGDESLSLNYEIINSGKDGFIYIDMIVTWVDKVGRFDHNAKGFRGHAFIDEEVGDGFFIVTLMEEEGVLYNGCYESISSDHKAYFKGNYGIDGIKYIDLGKM